jgi:hypothetical protein
MTRTELAIPLFKVAIGLALGAYFVWWSLEVLDRLTPEEEAPREPVTLRQGARVSAHRSIVPAGPGSILASRSPHASRLSVSHYKN